MSKMKRFFSIFIALCVGLVLWLWTPDTNYEEMREKYLTPQSQFIPLKNHQRIHVRDTGGDNKPVILMIHGTSDSLLTWDFISPNLVDKYRLVSLDLPGHGFSSWPVETAYDNLVASITQVLDTLGIESAYLMGNSLGGGIAWRVALEHQERVDGLILLNPSGAPRKAKSKSNLGFRILGNPVGRFFGRNITPRALIKKSLLETVSDPLLVTEEMVDRYWNLLRLPGNRHALTKLTTMPRSDSSWSKIREITTPTLVVWGAEDQIIPVSSGQSFVDALPNAMLLVYPETGHLPMVENPVKLAADIDDFIGQNDTDNQ